MKLTRITKIRAHRVFRDFAWPSDLHAFAQFNVIYGWNGCGKTTLSSLLSLAEKRAPLSEGELELEFDGTTKILGIELSTKPVPQVRVFNRDFINATLQSSGGIAPIYFLGENSVEKQAQITKFKEELALANAAVTTAESESNVAESKLNDFCIAKAKLIKELLTTANSPSYNNYDKRRFKDAMERLSLGTAVAAILSDSDKLRLRRLKDANPKEFIEAAAIPSIAFERLETDVEQLGERSVVAQTLDELSSDAETSSWVQRGLALHSGARHSDRCRFCEQPFRADRRSEIEAHFNDAFAKFQSELDELTFKLEAAKQSLSSIRLPEATRFYDHLIGDARTAIDAAMAVVSDAIATIDALLARVSTKRESPFNSLPRMPLASRGLDINEGFNALSAIIDKHNKTTKDFKHSVKEACEELERAYVAEAHAEYLQLSGNTKSSTDALKKVQGIPATIQDKINVLEREIVEHRRPADELTDELSAYLGRDELRFEVKGSGYVLTRSGQPVSHLSEGERTAIAFLGAV